MGSKSDLPVMQAAIDTVSDFNIPVTVSIVSAHRTPDRMVEFAKSAVDRKISVIIAGAGGAAHLPGMVASLTPLPVIGVPVNATALHGIDALLSIVQMPAGVPVATVGINNAKNAGILAVQIIGITDLAIQQKLLLFRKKAEDAVLEDTQNLEQ